MTTRIYKTESQPSLSDNHLELKTWCLCCYKNLSSGSVGRETPSDCDDKTEEVERFFKLLSRHLATGPERRNELSNLEAVISSGLVSGGDGGGRLGLCEGCREVVENFCEAYHRMKVAELEVDAKLWALMTVMTKADKGDNSVKKKEQKSGCVNAVENVRSNLLRQCRFKLDNVFPRPLLKRCDTIPNSSRGPTDPVSTTTKIKKYKCPHCPLKFGSSKFLKKHSQRIHLDKLLFAHKTEATSEEAFAKIVTKVVRNMSLKKKCQVCHRHYGWRKDVVSHIIQKHPKRVFLKLRRAQEVRGAGVKEERPQCKVCGKVFSRHIALLNHIKTHSGEKSFSCSYCDKCFRYSSKRRAHEIRFHPERILANYRAVQTTDLDFRRALSLVFRKLVVSLSDSCYECQCCEMKFGNRAVGLYHVVKQHNDHFSQEIRNAQAGSSGSTFSKVVGQSGAAQNTQLEGELDPLSEENEKEVEAIFPLGVGGNQVVQVLPSKSLQVRTSFACQICSKQFNRRDYVNRHMKVHTGTKPYKCTYCPRHFAERAAGTLHEIRCHRFKMLESVKEPALSDKQFVQVVNVLLDRFMVEKKCALCHRESVTKVRLEQHVLMSHFQRFFEELKNRQLELLREPPDLLESLIRKRGPPVVRAADEKGPPVAPASDERKLPRNEGKQLNFPCGYCNLSFSDSTKREVHGLRRHLEEVLAQFRAETTSLEDFGMGVREVLGGLVVAENSKSCRCLLCGKEYSAAKIYCERHVVQQHTDRFSQDIKAYQRQLSGLSSLVPTDSLEGVNEPLWDDNLEDVKSVPVATFIPKAESPVDEGGPTNPHQEEDLSILGI